jgi:hypothetical protein
MLILLLLQLLVMEARAEVGFHFVDEAAPEAVIKNQQFVFQMLAPGGREIMVDIKGETEDSLAEIAEARAAGRWRPELRAPMILDQLLLCQKQEISLCPVLEGIELSTAFLVKDPQYVVGTFHGLEDLMSSLEARGIEAEGLRLPVALLNGEGEVVRQGLTVHKLLSPEENNGVDLSFFAADGFEGGIPLSSGLKADEETFALGFASATFTRGRYGKKDAVTDRLSFTRGRKINGLSLRSLFSSSSYLRTDHDGNGGLSGGPLLNSSGEVAGVVASGVFDDKEEAPESLLSSDLAAAIRHLVI